MKLSKIIGITGSIATGKSQVSNILRDLGYTVIDSDLVAREIAEREDILDEIKKFFGDDATLGGKLNRSYVRDIVFKDEEKLKILNSIMHRTIYENILSRIKDGEINFIDVPLLFETIEEAKIYGLDYDEVWVVYSNPSIQLKRLMKRDNISKAEAQRIIDSQISIEEKKNLADYVVENNDGLENLRNNVLKALERL